MSLTVSADPAEVQLLKTVRSVGKGVIASAVSSITEVEWTDQMFVTDYWSKTIKFEEPDFKTKSATALSFLNFYISGELPDPDKINILFSQLIVCMSYAGNLIFPSNFVIKGSGFVSVGDSSFKDNTVPLFLNTQKRNDKSPTLSVEREGSSPEVIDENLYKQWYRHMYDLLTKTKEDGNTDPVSVQIAINALGFLAISSMRVLSKDLEAIESHIARTATTRIVGFWPAYQWHRATPPPHATYLQRLQPYFARFSTPANNILSILIYAYSYGSHTHITQVQGMLRAGCLLSLGELGLGMISWLIKAASAIDMNPNDLSMCLAVGQTMQSIRNLSKYITEKSNFAKTWTWARCLNEGAILYISTGQNIFFTLICLGISAGGDVNHDLAKIAQFNKYYGLPIFKDAFNFAAMVIQYQADVRLTEVKTEETKKIIEHHLARAKEERAGRLSPSDPKSQEVGGELRF